jgi:O-antigen ligase
MIHVLAFLVALIASYRMGMHRAPPGLVVFHIWMCWALFAIWSVPGLLELRWPIAGLTGLWGIGAWLHTRPGSQPVMRWTIALLVLCFFSCVYSLVIDYTILRAFGLMLLMFFALCGVSGLVQGPSALFFVMRSFVVLAITGSVYILSGYQNFESDLDPGVRFAVEGMKATGTATFSLMFTIFLVYQVKASRSPVARIVLTIVIIGLLVGMVSTRTRGTLVTACIVLPFLFVSLSGTRILNRVFVCYLGLAIAMPIALSISGKQEEVLVFLRLGSPEEIMRTRVEGRWDVALPKAMERPVLGRGFGSSRYFTIPDERLRDLDRTMNDKFQLTHNQFLCVFYELGIVGLAVFLVIILINLRQGYLIFTMHPSPHRDALLCLFAFYAQQVIGMNFHDGKLSVGSPSSYWFWICSILLGVGLTMSRHIPPPPPRGMPFEPGMEPPPELIR